MTPQQAFLLSHANERGSIYIDDKKHLPTVLIAEGNNYVAFNVSARIVQKATGGFFCVGSADVYTAFPKAWLIDRNLVHSIEKLTKGKVLIIDPL